MKYDVIVIGAGAAGLLAAAESAKRGLLTCVLERNSRPGRKLMITGKGRCNVTNFCDNDTFIKNVKSNPRFLYGAINAFDTQAVMDMFEALGVSLKVERGNRVFPVSDKAGDIVSALHKNCLRSGAEIIECEVAEVYKNKQNDFEIKSTDGTTFVGSNIIIATGGLSYPQTGSIGDGYRFAKGLGHKIMPTRPSLIPIVTNEKYCAEMMGLSLKNVTLTVLDSSKSKPKPTFKDMGELLFTHFGISGPLVLSASAHLNIDKLSNYKFFIDFKPGLTDDVLDKRLQKDFTKYSNKDFLNSLVDLLPSKSIPVIVRLSEIPPDIKVNQITKEQRTVLVNLIKKFPVTAKELRPIRDAVITAGGVCVKEINPATMESKILDGLYFAGEIIDVDAYTGGFNLQIAFSTGYVAGNNVGI